MKRFLILLITAILLFSILVLPISADEAAADSSNNQSASTSDDNKSLFEKIDNLLGALGEKMTENNEVLSILNGTIAEIDKSVAEKTIRGGGFNYVNEDSKLNSVISTVYQFIYPLSFIVLILCWAFGIAKKGVSVSIDKENPYSILYTLLTLIIAIIAMTLSPYLLTLLTSISQWMCCSIFDAVDASRLFDLDLAEIKLSIRSLFSDESPEVQFKIIVFIVVVLIFMLNVLWIALLQCLSPIFIALMVNKSTRKIGLNFIKEYFKAILVPVVTVIYFALASSFLGDIETLQVCGLIVSLVLAISTLGIAGKKLDKLIN